MSNTNSVCSISRSLSCLLGCQNVRPVKIWWQLVYTVHKGLFTLSSLVHLSSNSASSVDWIADTIGNFPHHQCKWPIIGRKICGANAFLTPSSVSCFGKGDWKGNWYSSICAYKWVCENLFGEKGGLRWSHRSITLLEGKCYFQHNMTT